MCNGLGLYTTSDVIYGFFTKMEQLIPKSFETKKIHNQESIFSTCCTSS
jgi:hypothetical protein